jgi:hypothetical protein
LKHTIFICKDEYNATKKEIFNEASKWCENWKVKYLHLFNPYSPREEANSHKEIFHPLWKQLNNETKLIKTTKLKKIYGWNTNLTDLQIDRLFKLLIKGGFILEDTPPVNFKCAFSHNPLPSGFTPIVWLGKQSDLIRLYESLLKEEVRRPKQPWVHFNKLFNLDAPGQPFNTNSLKTQFQGDNPMSDELSIIYNKLY